MSNSNIIHIRKYVLNSVVLSLLTSVFLVQSISLVLAKPKYKQAPSQPQTIETPRPMPVNVYDQAKNELPESFYTLYRVFERIDRANNLDKNAWRLTINSEYDPNAFTTEQNLIVVYDGLLKRLALDPSAIACEVSHQAAHNTLRHTPMSNSEKQALMNQYRTEATEQAKQEAESAQQAAAAANVGSSVLQSAGGFFGGLFGIAGNVVGSAVSAVGSQTGQDPYSKVESVVKQKQEELDKKNAEASRLQNLEADKLTYQYVAKAGFDPKGCLRLLETLSKVANTENNGANLQERNKQFEVLMLQTPVSSLAQDGKLYLESTRPLSYSISKNDNSLKINSRYGGSSEVIDRMLQ